MIWIRGGAEETQHDRIGTFFYHETDPLAEHEDLPEFAELEEVFSKKDENGQDPFYKQFLSFVKSNKTLLQHIFALKHDPDKDENNPYNPESPYYSEFLMKQFYRNLQANAYEIEHLEDIAYANAKLGLVSEYESLITRAYPFVFMSQYLSHPMISLKLCVLKYGTGYKAGYLELKKLQQALYLSNLRKSEPEKGAYLTKVQDLYNQIWYYYEKLGADPRICLEVLRLAEQYKYSNNEKGVAFDHYGDERDIVGVRRDFNQHAWLTDPIARSAILYNEIPTSLRQKLQYDKLQTIMEIWDNAARTSRKRDAMRSFLPLPQYRDRRRYLGHWKYKFWDVGYKKRQNPNNIYYKKINRWQQRLFMINKRLSFLTRQHYGRLWHNYEEFDRMFYVVMKPYRNTNNDRTWLGTWSLDNFSFNPWVNRYKVPQTLHSLRYTQLNAVNLVGETLLHLRSLDRKYNKNRQQIYEALEAIGNDPDLFVNKNNLIGNLAKEDKSQVNFKLGEWEQLVLLAEENYYDDLQKKTITTFWCPVQRTFVVNMYPKPVAWFLMRYYSKIGEAITLNDKITGAYYRRYLNEITKSLSLGGPVNVSPPKEWPVQFHWIWYFLKKKYIKNLPYSFFGVSSSAAIAQKLENKEILPQFDSESLSIDHELAQEALLNHVRAYASNLLDNAPSDDYTRHFMHNGVPYYFRGTPIIDTNEVFGSITPEKISDAVRLELIEQKVLGSLVPTYNAPQPNKLNDILGNIYAPQYTRPIEFFNSFHIFQYPKYELCPPWAAPYENNWINPKTGEINDFWYLKEIYEECGISEIPTSFGFCFGHEIVHLISFLICSVSLIYIPMTDSKIPKIIALLSGIVLFFHVFPYWI